MNQQPRKWSDLRPQPQAVDQESKDFCLAMWRLSLTAEGKMLIAWLQYTSTYRVLSPESHTDSALWALEGRRHVPADLQRYILAGERYASESSSE